MDAAITVAQLRSLLQAFPPPALLDVRSEKAFAENPALLPSAIRRPPDTIAAYTDVVEPWRPVVVYCVHGHEVSQRAATVLNERGVRAQFLHGGMEAWCAAGGALFPYRAPTRWVTRERPKIDRIACPWLIRRFLDPAAEFFYVANASVREFARAERATPYDIPDVEYSHDGPRCSFDAFIRRHALDDRALDRLAGIVRGADTAMLDLAPQAPGLLAVSLGLSQMITDDHAMLRWGMLVYDSLYAWCRQASGETHGWNPAALRIAQAG